MPKCHDPEKQIHAGNAWYTDEQFAKQYDRPDPRAVIENRWRVFQRPLNKCLNLGYQEYRGRNKCVG